jgi:hypothetical protein
MIGGNNMITIHGNGAIITIIVIEHLRNNVKRPKILLCCIFQNNITYDEDVMFTTKFKLFSICIIGLHVGIVFAYIVNTIVKVLTLRIIYLNTTPKL